MGLPPHAVRAWAGAEQTDQWKDAIPTCWGGPSGGGSCPYLAVVTLDGGELACALHAFFKPGDRPSGVGGQLLTRAALIDALDPLWKRQGQHLQQQIHGLQHTSREQARVIEEQARSIQSLRQGQLRALADVRTLLDWRRHLWGITRLLIRLQGNVPLA